MIIAQAGWVIAPPSKRANIKQNKSTLPRFSTEKKKITRLEGGEESPNTHAPPMAEVKIVAANRRRLQGQRCEQRRPGQK